jgi:hypothetical protein
MDFAADTLGSVHDWQAEWKWDGIRAQVIKRQDHVFMWSRGEDLITERFPEIAEAAQDADVPNQERTAKAKRNCQRCPHAHHRALLLRLILQSVVNLAKPLGYPLLYCVFILGLIELHDSIMCINRKPLAKHTSEPSSSFLSKLTVTNVV